MKIALMQPYIFPYVGYFKLIGSVDKFVFYDDVNFIKRGWINRNRLHLSGDVRYFTIPLNGASQNRKINEIEIQSQSLWKKKIIRSICLSYSKAPFFQDTIELIDEVLSSECQYISELAKMSVMKTAERLHINVEFVSSSSCYDNSDLSGSERVVDICMRENAKEYVNLPGGIDLYKESDFSNCGIKLLFLDVQAKSYQQLTQDFVPWLSVIDILMFNSIDEARYIIGIK